MSEGQSGLAIKPQANNQGVLRLLILEESSTEAQSLINPLRDAGYAITAARVKSPLEFQVALKKQEWDIIFSPPSTAKFNAKQALGLLVHAKMDVPFIIISDHFTDKEFTEALRFGARALIQKDQVDQLLLIIQRELHDLAMRRARHHYEKMFRESERRCQILLESSRNAIACIRHGKVIYSNPAFSQLISKGKEQGSNNLLSLIHPDDRQRFEELLRGVESGKNLSDRAELKILDANDKPLPVKVEAIVAHVNEQQCAQVSISLTAGPGNAVNQTQPQSMMERQSQGVGQKGGNASPIADPKDVPHPRKDDPAMIQRLRDALSENRFKLVFQPIVPLHAQPAERYEVLTRKIDVDGKEILPANFMPIAEKAGLMPEIDRWVIRASMQTLAKQHSEKKETSLLVKLSEDSLGDHTLVPWIGEQLTEFHLPGDTLIFEIKEADVIQRLEGAKQLINGLKQLHCRTALGHFGADPRSLDHLEQLHVDFVKLASIFVDKLSDDPKSQAMVKAVVQTAHDLGTLTIATFVQDASKMASLWQCNVDYIQGYFLQAPDTDMSFNFSEDEN
jgi:EAL domain-containing protein (putative c-di-GMP-specific phosphodiesterase class I)/PAS domain-containing protein